MDISTSSLSTAKTRNEFINKAHEARQARELERRRDEAATKIQAYIRTFCLRQKLKRDAFQSLDQLGDKTLALNANDLLLILRKLLFLCHPIKDWNVLNKLIQFISESINSAPNQPQQHNILDTNSNNNDQTQQPVVESNITTIELSQEHINKLEKEPRNENIATLPVDGKQRNFLILMIAGASKDDQSLYLWISTLRKILSLCMDYLQGKHLRKLDRSKLELQYANVYLHLVYLFTSKDSLQSSISHTNNTETVKRIAKELSDKTLSKRKHVFCYLSTYISETVNKTKSDLKSRLLSNYVNIAINLLEPACLASTNDERRDFGDKTKGTTEILTQMLCIPAFSLNLEMHSPNSLAKLNECYIYKLCLEYLAKNEQYFQKLTSTPSLCLLANFIHIASLNEDELACDVTPFVLMTTKLLESCQKNMKQIIHTNNNQKKIADSTDKSYNHILGWLTREQTPIIDEDTAKLIKSQLSHLWNIKFLKILLSDLTKANEKLVASKQNNSSSNTAKAHTSNSPSKSKTNILSKLSSFQDNQTLSDMNTSPRPIIIFKRAVERAANTMTKTINSYSKTTGPSNSSGTTKLMTSEAIRISLVCSMLHTALKTLRVIKQNILMGLCLYDYILKNLWQFISSLGPQNGLKVFLDHLAIHTKSNAPEFHLLTLFCECSSHLISILDDSELYEQQRPFSLDDLISISAFLNVFVFRVISNNLVPYSSQEMDPTLQTTHKLLTDLYKRDCRRKFAPPDHWLIKEIKMSVFLKDLEAEKPVAQTILTMLPHIIPHKERVLIFRKLVAKDKAQYRSGYSTFITIHRSRIVEDGYQQLVSLPPNALKGLIRVKFINDHGLDEAGIDQDGVFKEFLEDTIKRVFDPAINLFCSTSEQRLYPSPTSRLHEDHLSLFNFVGKMLGKAVYEGIVVDVPFASFFLSRVLGQPQSPLYSPIDELPSLDPELYKSLTYIKHYEGDVNDLGLTFSIDQDFMGKIETYELESGGKFIPVTKESRVRYIHSVANFRMKTQIEEQTESFVRGFKSIVNLDWLSMFSASEFQRLISGDTSPIDIQDLRRHTKYFGGFHNNHRVICWLWDILEKDFSAEEHRLFLKFVTSCSKPPLLGFANLEPPFTIRCVEVSDDQDLGDTVGSVLRGFFAIRRSDPVDRLPTSSTCFNLLKLPNYQRRSTLRDKLRYAIQCNPGFELS